MGYVQFILDSRIKAQTEIPSAPAALKDLPGLHRREGIIETEKSRAKVEYNVTLKRIRDLNKKLRGVSGGAKKDYKIAVAQSREHAESQLKIIGTYTPEEKLHGFKEDDNGF